MFSILWPESSYVSDVWGHDVPVSTIFNINQQLKKLQTSVHIARSSYTQTRVEDPLCQ